MRTVELEESRAPAGGRSRESGFRRSGGQHGLPEGLSTAGAGRRLPRPPRRAPRSGIACLLLTALAGPAVAEGLKPAGPLREVTPVRPGVEVLLTDSLHLVRGRRLGLITNQTGVDSGGRSSIDLLDAHPELELVALFSPEHGIRGTAAPGERIDSSRDPATGLPIHSLYGATRKPTPEMLEGVELLLFDIQDVGTRYYTYIYTMLLGMEAAAERGIPFLVLDRPNPIGGALVQGNVLDPAFSSFVGMVAIPMRHGMTPGELARLFRDRFGIRGEAPLHIVPAEGWSRATGMEGTGLPWIPPSPNMPSVDSALHYPGTCLFEGTPLSVGRGTAEAFQQIGAPWIDGVAMAERLAQWELPGVRFIPVRFTPRAPGDGKFAGVEVGGVRWEATDPDRYDPTLAGAAALVEAVRASGSTWSWEESHFDRLAGGTTLRRWVEETAGARGTAAPDPSRDQAALRALALQWEREREAFAVDRERALLSAYAPPS